MDEDAFGEIDMDHFLLDNQAERDAAAADLEDVEMHLDNEKHD